MYKQLTVQPEALTSHAYTHGYFQALRADFTEQLLDGSFIYAHGIYNLQSISTCMKRVLPHETNSE